MNINWIKLDINILDDQKIKIIRSYPDGNALFALWIGLLCMAMKGARAGIIEIADGLPYSLADLASALNISQKTVELGLTIFAKYRMIDIFDGNTIEVINFSKHQKLEVIEHKRELARKRTNEYRMRLRTGDALVTRHSVTVTPTDTDTETEKHTDKHTDTKCVSPVTDNNFSPQIVDCDPKYYPPTKGIEAEKIVNSLISIQYPMGGPQPRNLHALRRTFLKLLDAGQLERPDQQMQGQETDLPRIRAGMRVEIGCLGMYEIEEGDFIRIDNRTVMPSGDIRRGLAAGIISLVE
jgi:predicted phage replisome organizer